MNPPLPYIMHLVKPHTFSRLRVVTKLYGILRDAHPCKVKGANKWRGYFKMVHRCDFMVTLNQQDSITVPVWKPYALYFQLSPPANVVPKWMGGSPKWTNLNRSPVIGPNLWCGRGEGATILCDLSHDVFNVTLTTPMNRQTTVQTLAPHDLAGDSL